MALSLAIYLRGDLIEMTHAKKHPERHGQIRPLPSYLHPCKPLNCEHHSPKLTLQYSPQPETQTLLCQIFLINLGLLPSWVSP